MRNDPFSLEGKTILVTGASSGIGRASALLCAQMGATVLLTGRNAANLDSALAQLPGAGHTLFVGDLTHEAVRNALVDVAPALDGCVFSAGVAELAPIRMITERHLRSIFSVNYEAPVLLTQRLLAKKKIATGGSLVFVTAVAEHIAPVATGAYSAAKAALTATVRTIALEHAKQGIRANCVSPGYVATPMLDKMRSVSTIDEKISLVPLGCIEPEEVAQCIAYLLAPASRWVTRSALVIDGGLSLHVR